MSNDLLAREAEEEAEVKTKTANPVSSLGRKLRASRRSKGLSQQALEAELKLPSASVEAFENGASVPIRSVLRRLERRLGVHLSDDMPKASPKVSLRPRSSGRQGSSFGYDLSPKDPWQSRMAPPLDESHFPPPVQGVRDTVRGRGGAYRRKGARPVQSNVARTRSPATQSEAAENDEHRKKSTTADAVAVEAGMGLSRRKPMERPAARSPEVPRRPDATTVAAKSNKGHMGKERPAAGQQQDHRSTSGGALKVKHAKQKKPPQASGESVSRPSGNGGRGKAGMSSADAQCAPDAAPAHTRWHVVRQECRIAAPCTGHTRLGPSPLRRLPQREFVLIGGCQR